MNKVYLIDELVGAIANDEIKTKDDFRFEYDGVVYCYDDLLEIDLAKGDLTFSLFFTLSWKHKDIETYCVSEIFDCNLVPKFEKVVSWKTPGPRCNICNAIIGCSESNDDMFRHLWVCTNPACNNSVYSNDKKPPEEMIVD